MATPPRIIIPGRRVYLTIRAVNRQYRFVPTPDVVESIEFIFWYCVQKHGIAVHETAWMSNHAHACITDVEGRLPRFVCQMNSLISRQLNTLRGGKGTNFEKGYSEIEIADEASMHRLSAYTLANPCAADLVRTAAAWQGFSTYKREYNTPFKVSRPKCGMWAEKTQTTVRKPEEQNESDTKGLDARVPNKKKVAKPARRKPSKLPSEVQAVLTRPDIKQDLSDHALRAEIRETTHQREAIAEKRRKNAKREILGWSRVLENKWHHFPKKTETVFQKEPRVAAECQLLREHRLNLISVFNQSYESARKVYVEDDPKEAVFPYGTWKLCIELNANCETRPPI